MSKRLHIFVIDDNVDLATSTGNLLKTFEHDPHVFTSAEEALAALDTVTPDVILSDIAMPRMDGCELARQLKLRPNCQNVVLVAVTALGDDRHRHETVEAGFDYRFVKPLAPIELREFLTQVQSHPRGGPSSCVVPDESPDAAK